MPEPELGELAADIKEHGLIETIVIMADGFVLDGRNRWLACELNGITPRTRLFGSEPTDGDDPISFVLSKNKNRRHMSYAEKCFVADALATLAHGTNQHANKVDASKEAPSSLEASQTMAAKILGISRSGAQDARIIREEGGPEVVEQVKAGKCAIRATATAMRAKRKATNNNIPAENQANRQPSVTSLKRQEMLLNRPILKAVDNGRPRGVEALEQAPGYPPGMTKGMVWTETHGRVETRTHEEVARAKLYDRLIEFNALIRKIVKADAWPTYDDLATLDPRRRSNVLHEWSKHRVALYAVLDVSIGHPKMSATDDRDEVAS
jgi:hypothetical protein